MCDFQWNKICFDDWFIEEIMINQLDMLDWLANTFN